MYPSVVEMEAMPKPLAEPPRCWRNVQSHLCSVEISDGICLDIFDFHHDSEQQALIGYERAIDFPLLSDQEPMPEWFARFGEAVAGQKVDDNGVLEKVNSPSNEIQVLRGRLYDVPNNWKELAIWLCRQEGAEAPLSPLSNYSKNDLRKHILSEGLENDESQIYIEGNVHWFAWMFHDDAETLNHLVSKVWQDSDAKLFLATRCFYAAYGLVGEFQGDLNSKQWEDFATKYTFAAELIRSECDRQFRE